MTLGGGRVTPLTEQVVLRFLIGGLTVSFFSAVGDTLKPKTFAGLFGGAPSVALATLGLAMMMEGKIYAASEARSMTAGAVALFVYAADVSWMMMRYKAPALVSSAVMIVLWFGASFGLWWTFLR